ncbi:malate dehydrogenase (quinone) [Terriglobus roseus]|uniref:Probable malate:quinone oxidoreductase n=1 Tax=Terriglobus roseus TaxID=392734 RepID=A0A1H4JCF5_9BACT|nr:malate dehydrogenase (quinone) [Terriglobus roseus]SEB43983.1 malate dehydrogenase (quinone) [Terriglobus roseus]
MSDVASLPAETDVLLVGAGIMSATLGTLLKTLAPSLRITVVDALEQPAIESSDAWNNAGTGHAALCELNYTPEGPDGTIAIDRAIKINEQFQHSRQFWASLVQRGLLADPRQFINRIPHMSFVSGAPAVDFLRRRFAAMQVSPLFRSMQFSDNPAQVREWIPLMMASRDASEPVAATRSEEGTDLNFGALTRLMLGSLQQQGSGIFMRHKVTGLTKLPDTRWYVEVENLATKKRTRITTRFIFLGAGGGALPLLQQSGIPEGRGYGGFPVSGQWLRCTNRAVIEQHAAKVYGKPALGAPPMSVPHLDTRVIDGKRELLFGPFAGFTTKFLKTGSFLDLPGSVGPGNLVSMLGAGATNLELTKYLIGQVLQSQEDRINALREFVPTARGEDWVLEIAGQRVQIIKPDPKMGGKLEFGTEIVRSADGSLAALLGASPGASTAVSIMLELIMKGTPVLSAEEGSAERLRDLVPSYGRSMNNDPELLTEMTAKTNRLLQLA